MWSRCQSFLVAMEDLLKYVAANLQFPASAADVDVEGRCIVQFVVTKTGEVGKVKVMRSLSPDCDAEAIRLCETLPRFTPGRKDGQVVNVMVHTPNYLPSQQIVWWNTLLEQEYDKSCMVK